MNSVRTKGAEAFRSALEAHDFVRARKALEEYLAWFRSGPRTVDEIRKARDLFEWGVRNTTAQKARISEDLMILKSVLEAYGPRPRSSTWRLEA